MNRNLLRLSFSLLACTGMLAFSQHAAQAQSAHILAYSDDVPDVSNGDVPIVEPVSQTTSVVAPNMQPTDLIGNIWKRANQPNAAGNGRTVSSTTPSRKLPVVDLTAAAK